MHRGVVTIVKKKRNILIVITILTLTAAVTLIYQNRLELRVLRLFNIQMIDSIDFLTIEMSGQGSLVAELIIPFEMVESVFQAYESAAKFTDIELLRPDIRRRVEILSGSYELDYFNILMSSARRGFRPIFELAETRERHIVFMEESEGQVLVFLASTHACGTWW
jgi:hypothetical protein